jgi:hypothetical protein
MEDKLNKNKWEYIIETKEEKEWQKHLNQWKHQYEMEILNSFSSGECHNKVTLILRRRDL